MSRRMIVISIFSSDRHCSSLSSLAISAAMDRFILSSPRNNGLQRLCIAGYRCTQKTATVVSLPSRCFQQLTTLLVFASPASPAQVRAEHRREGPAFFISEMLASCHHQLGSSWLCLAYATHLSVHPLALLRRCGWLPAHRWWLGAGLWAGLGGTRVALVRQGNRATKSSRVQYRGAYQLTPVSERVPPVGLS